MLDKDDIFERLGELVRLDMDAANAYNEAIEKTDDEQVRARFGDLRDDHQRHVQELSGTIERMGGTPPEPGGGVAGVLIEGTTALRSTSGAEGALKAMRTDELFMNHRYGDAIGWDMPTDVRSTLMRQHADEQRHLAYIEGALSVGAGTRDYGERGGY